MSPKATEDIWDVWDYKAFFDEPRSQTCPIGYDPATAHLFADGLRELLYRKFQAPFGVSLSVYLLSGNHLDPERVWEEPFKSTIPKVIGLCHPRGWLFSVDADNYRLGCDPVIINTVPGGFWIWGYLVVAHFFSTGLAGSLWPIVGDRLHALPSLTSNGGEVILNFGAKGILQIDPITARLAGIRKEVR